MKVSQNLYAESLFESLSAHYTGQGSFEAAALLALYDRHRRVLPWRAKAGEVADPYRVWLSEIMLQQTTVKTVAPYYARFLELFPRVQDLAAAPLVAVLQVIASLKVFDQMYLMTSGGPNFATRSILQYVYDQGFTNYRVGYAAAVSMLFFLVVLAVSAVWFTIVRRQERTV